VTLIPRKIHQRVHAENLRLNLHPVHRLHFVTIILN